MTAKLKTLSSSSCDTTFPYELDYIDHLLARERRKEEQFSFKARSPQLNYRKSLIKSLKCLASKLHLASTTVHLAAHLLDLFMDNHDILPSQLMLTASTCLLISAKYVDVDQNIPKASQLQRLTDHRNSLQEYLLMEKMLLNFLGWDLNFATPANFLEFLLSWEQQFTSYDGRMENSTCDLVDFKLVASQLANLTLAEVQFIDMKPSLVAASCFAAARVEFQMYPIWPLRLEKLTGYTLTDLEHCVQSICYVRINLHSVIGFVPQTVHSVQTVSLPWGNSQQMKKCKLKAVPASYNCARTRRQLFQSRDLKKMYCAM